MHNNLRSDVIYRQALKEDSNRIAELDYIASGGTAEFLFHDLVPDATPVEVITYGLEHDNYPHSYRSALVAELNHQIIGMILSYPASFHGVNDEMRSFFPAERLAYFRDFFSARVDDSYYIDALCVDETYRSQGIGESLIARTIEKAREEGFSVLSLIVFADNQRAIKFYQRHGFVTVRQVELKKHPLIPHLGGCILMKADI